MSAWDRVVAAEPVLASIKNATRAGKLPRARPDSLVDAAVEAGIISADDAALVHAAQEARRDAIQVDSFPAEGFAAAVPTVSISSNSAAANCE